jgi:hypothetical protein
VDPLDQSDMAIKNRDVGVQRTGEAQPEVSHAKALYDFAAQNEGDLAFSAGDVIVITDASETWWKGYRAESPQSNGVFPSNYVEVCEAGDTGLRLDLKDEATAEQPSEDGRTLHTNIGVPQANGPEQELSRAKALYDFAAQNEGDLAFSAGDELMITDATDTWWKGYRAESPQSNGVFPSNYVEVLGAQGVTPWVRVLQAEPRESSDNSGGSNNGRLKSVRSSSMRSNSGRSRSSRKDMMGKWDTWFLLRVGTNGIDEPQSNYEMWRSLSQLLSLQMELAKEFTGYSPAALDSIDSASSSELPAKQELVQLMFDGIGVHEMLRESSAVQQLLMPDFISFDVRPQLPLSPVSAKISEMTGVSIAVDDIIECQRRRSYLEPFSVAALLATDPQAWVRPDGTSTGPETEAMVGWQWVGTWEADSSAPECDADGWSYAFYWSADFDAWKASNEGSCLVRRRWHSRLQHRVEFDFDVTLLESAISIHRKQRAHADAGGSLLRKLERTLSTVASRQDRAGLAQEMKMVSKPVKNASSEQTKPHALSELASLTPRALQPEHLSVAFYQFTLDTIQAVLEEFDGDPIMAAKRLSKMVGDPAQGDAALQKLGLSAFVTARQEAVQHESEQDMDAYLQCCFEQSTDGASADSLKMTKDLDSESLLEDITASDLEAAYLGSLCCLAGGSIHGNISEVPQELTDDSCDLLRSAILGATLTGSGDDEPSDLKPVKRASGLSIAPPPTPTPRERAAMHASDELLLDRHNKLLSEAFDMRSRLVEELERQMYSMKTHHYYQPDAFATPQHYAEWRVKEQVRLSGMIEHVQSLAQFEGELLVRVRQGSGLEPSTPSMSPKKLSCRVTVGDSNQCTDSLPIQEGGNVLWTNHLQFYLHQEPTPPCIRFEIVEEGGTVKAVKPVAKSRRASIIALPGKAKAKAKGAGVGGGIDQVVTERVIGTGRLFGLPGLWCPPPHYVMYHVEIRKDAGSDREVVGIVTFELQYSYAKVQAAVTDWSEQQLFAGVAEKSLGKLHADAHRMFRILVRLLDRVSRGESDDVGSDMLLAPALGWLYDQFCGIFGVGEVYRRIFELRVILLRFEPSASCLGRVSIALNDVTSLTEGDSTTWTVAERQLYDDMLLHLQEALSRCFVTYKTTFPLEELNSGALEMAVAIFGVVMDDADAVLRSFVMQYGDRVVDIILQGADEETVRPLVLSCLLKVLVQEFQDDSNAYSTAFPPGLHLLETHAEQYAGVDSRVCHAINNCIYNMTQDQYGEDESLQLYDDAQLLILSIQKRVPSVAVFDYKHAFSPIVDSHMRLAQDRMMVWAWNAAKSEESAIARSFSTAPSEYEDEFDELAAGLHSNSVQDLFMFCSQGVHELQQLCSSERVMNVLCLVVGRYCDAVANECKGQLNNCSPLRSSKEPAAATEQALQAAKTSFNKFSKWSQKMVAKTQAMVDQGTITPDVYESGEENEDEVHLEFSVPSQFWVHLNNLWVVSEKRLMEIGADPSIILGESIDADLQEQMSDTVDCLISQIRRQTRDAIAILVDTTSPAIRTEIRSTLRRFLSQMNANNILTADQVWKPVLDAVESLLEGPSTLLYADTFQKVLRQFCLALYSHLQDVLDGSLPVKGWRSPGPLVDVIDEGIALTKDYFCSGGVAESYLRHITGKQSGLIKFLSLHNTDTEGLVEMYTAIINASHTGPQSSLVDQAADISGVLGTRSATDSGAEAFMLEIGVSAYGRVPDFLDLPSDERLDAKVVCKHRLVGTLYATSGYLCFEPVGLGSNILEDEWERTLRDQYVMEATVRVDIREICYLLKEKTSTGRDTMLEVGTVGDETFLFSGFSRRSALTHNVKASSEC